MTPQTFARAIVSIEQKYNLRLDANEVWLRLDEFKKVKELKGGKCNEENGWYGLKGACKRGKKGEGDAKGKESKMEIARKIKARKGIKPIGESASIQEEKKPTAPIERPPVAAKKEAIAAKADKRKAGDPMHDPDSHISESISGGYRVMPPEASDLIKRYKGISVIDRDDAELLTSLRGNGDTKKDVEGIAKQLAESLKYLDSPPTSTDLSSEQSKIRAGKKIKSQADFDKEVDRFVKVADPGDFEIYKLRRSLGDRMTRSEFDSMLMNAQSKGHLQLYGGSLKGRNDLALLDSVATETSGLRTYFRKN